jgi:hypothetical protein
VISFLASESSFLSHGFSAMVSQPWFLSHGSDDSFYLYAWRRAIWRPARAVPGRRFSAPRGAPRFCAQILPTYHRHARPRHDDRGRAEIPWRAAQTYVVPACSHLQCLLCVASCPPESAPAGRMNATLLARGSSPRKLVQSQFRIPLVILTLLEFVVAQFSGPEWAEFRRLISLTAQSSLPGWEFDHGTGPRTMNASERLRRHPRPS